jgi:hypothetical protein
MEWVETGEKRRRQHERSVCGVMFTMIFGLVMFSFLATAMAHFFGVFHIIQKTKVDVDEMRLKQLAIIGSTHCLHHVGKLSTEERAKYPLVHKIPTEECDTAAGLLAESVWSQRGRFFFNNYAWCETGKCTELFSYMITNTTFLVCLFGVPIIVLLLLLLWNRGSSNHDMSQELLMRLLDRERGKTHGD